MKIRYFSFLFCLVGLYHIALSQHGTLTVKILDQVTLLPLAHASVVLNNEVFLTNQFGLAPIPLPENDFTLSVYANDYITQVLTIRIAELSDTLQIALQRQLISHEQKDFVIVSLEDLETDKGTQPIASLLTTHNDPHLAMALYQLSFCRYSYRGYAARYADVYINNIPMSDPETELNIWSEWGGLNDAMRNQESYSSHMPASFGFGSVGGLTNINTRPSIIGQQHKMTYAISNRSYNNRITYIYSSGLTKKNWAFTIHGSRRWALQGYVPGTWYDAYAIFAAAEKKLNAHHNLSAIFFYSPYRRALQSPAIQEAYDLAGTNYYNPNWGWQEGKMRNARVRSLHKPTFILHHIWNISEKNRLNTAIAYAYTDFGTTGLNWYDAPDPRPDYYRYMPSFQTSPYLHDIVAEQWQQDENVRQINWNQLYQINYLQNLENKQAKYILENRKKIAHTATLTSNLKTQLNQNVTLYTALEAQHYYANYFKQIEDLLGGTHWLDIDQFAERDFSGDTAVLLNDLQNPYKKIYEGDRFGYDYILYRQKIRQWSLLQYTGENFDAYFSYACDVNKYQREGKMQNGRYPDASLGKGKPIYFITPSVKTGFLYKINGRNLVTSNLALISLPPLMNEIYIIPTISHLTITNPSPEVIFAADVANIYTGSIFSYRISLYRTHFFNQTDQIQFYHDDLRTFVSLTMTDIEKVHMGIETGFSAQITDNLLWNNFVALGDHTYRSRPQATIAYTNNAKPDTVKTIYIMNFYDYTSPQFVATTGLRYNFSRFFSVQLNANYFDKYFMSFNPERRTEAALTNLGPDDPLIDQIVRQYRFPSAYTLDATIFRSWKIKNSFVSLFVSINNLLNDKNIQTGGFEQLRFDFQNKNVDKFPPKFFYGYGRTYFVMLSIRI